MMLRKSQGNTIANGEKRLEANERYIFKSNKEHKNLDGIKVYYSGHKGSLLFYKYKLMQVGQKIVLENNGKFNLNDKVLVCHDSLKNVLMKRYHISLIDAYDNAQLVKITKILSINR